MLQNLLRKKILLNSGYEMPVIGLGTWTLYNEIAENAVYNALKSGYKLIDTAKNYENELAVGKGIKRTINEGLVTRKEIFVTTKIAPINVSDYDKIIDECNEELGLDYIDLMLIHNKSTSDIKLYKAIEKAIDDKKVHSWGISNYYTKEDFDKIVENVEIMPAIIQNENHPFFQNLELQKYVANKGTVIESYYPLGGMNHTKDLMKNNLIEKIARKYGKTSAQIILRWHIQSKYIVIPGTSKLKHIKENIDIFDFELADNEMQEINNLNTNIRYENW